MTIRKLREQYLAGETHPVQVIESLAEKIQSQDTSTKAYISFDLERAIEIASKSDVSKLLGGIPIAIKDNINTLNQPCSCGSKFLEKTYVSPYDATSLEKLIEAGAIPFGRVNMDEFAMGSATENSAIQLTRNPVDPERIAGGSSGGSAAAVADGTAIAALGSDTGGSIRQPASHCGVVGLKPTYGRVSRYGLVAFASSLDQIGPLTQTVDDAAILLQAIAGYDPRDSTSLDLPVPDFSESINDGVDGLRLGIPKEYFTEKIHSGVRETIQNRIDLLESQGAEIVPISLPNTKHVVATYYVIAPAEASSNLSRFDGIRYGNRSENASDIVDVYHKSREAGFGPEVKRRIILGTYVLSSGYYDAYYTQAQKARKVITQDFNEAFKKVDAILAPTCPTPARKIGGCSDPLEDYLSDIFTIGANLAGIPGISIPAGTTDFDGAPALPVGLQILAPHMDEQMLLRVAKAAELPQQ
ncbi:MAG: Asp-tRNA(Asn)/Glu-tRNA(Gln) amidotransferase subunit GatA [Akkermansiaceae bacterium]